MFPHNTSGETALTKFCSFSSYVCKSSLQAGLTELTQVLPLKSALCALAYTCDLGLRLSDKGVVHIVKFWAKFFSHAVLSVYLVLPNEEELQKEACVTF